MQKLLKEEKKCCDLHFENPDPRGEYLRECPYCGDEFISGHMNREYCPEKNGIKDWCKNRYKRIAKLEKQNEIIDDVIAPPPDIVAPKEIIVQPAVVIATTPQMENISLLGGVLRNYHRLKLPVDYLSSIGFKYEAYDNEYQIPGTELRVLTYGPYAIAWGYETHIILTYKKHLKWIQ